MIPAIYNYLLLIKILFYIINYIGFTEFLGKGSGISWHFSTKKGKENWRKIKGIYIIYTIYVHYNINIGTIVGESETALCQYIVKYLPGVLKEKTKVIYIFYTDKKCFIKFNVD